MGVFKQPLNQNRQPNQRRPYNSGDSDYDDDNNYSGGYSSNNYNSNNYSSNSYHSRHDNDYHDDSDGDDGDD